MESLEQHKTFLQKIAKADKREFAKIIKHAKEEKVKVLVEIILNSKEVMLKSKKYSNTHKRLLKSFFKKRWSVKAAHKFV